MNIKKIISTIAVIGCLSACMIPAVSYADEVQYEPEISMLANNGNYSIEYVKPGYELDYSTTKENYNISLKCHNSSNETRTADVYAVLYSDGLIKEIRKQSLIMLDDSSNSVVFYKKNSKKLLKKYLPPFVYEKVEKVSISGTYIMRGIFFLSLSGFLEKEEGGI